MAQKDIKTEEKQINTLPSKTICWNCKKACGGCSWSQDFVPVEGWKVAKGNNCDARTKSQDVISCPLYERDRKYFTTEEIFKVIAKHFGKDVRTIRRWGKIRTPFVYAEKYQEDTGDILPTWFWYDLQYRYNDKM